MLGEIKLADVEKIVPIPSSAYFEVCVCKCLRQLPVCLGFFFFSFPSPL